MATKRQRYWDYPSKTTVEDLIGPARKRIVILFEGPQHVVDFVSEDAQELLGWDPTDLTAWDAFHDPTEHRAMDDVYRQGVTLRVARTGGQVLLTPRQPSEDRPRGIAMLIHADTPLALRPR
jgi:hypothetical protein